VRRALERFDEGGVWIGLVVKKGLNILSFTSAGMPVPLSRILISTRSPRFAQQRFIGEGN
jgi:hypothetical protein